MKRRLLVAIDKAPILCYKLLQDLLQATHDVGRITNTKTTFYQAFTCTLGGDVSNPLVASKQNSGLANTANPFCLVHGTSRGTSGNYGAGHRKVSVYIYTEFSGRHVYRTLIDLQTPVDIYTGFGPRQKHSLTVSRDSCNR